MKKIVLASIVAASSLFALTNDEIKGLYSNLPHGLTIEIEERSEVKEFPGVDMVVIKVTDGKMSQTDVVFTKDDFMIQDLFNAKTGVSYKDDYLRSQTNKNIAEVYKKEDSKNIIKLGDDDKKPTTLIFSDPRCPHCQNTVANLDSILKDSNVELISLSFIGGPDSVARNAKMYEEAGKEKDLKKRIEIVQKYYKTETKVDPASEADSKAMIDITNKYSNAGINSVPYIIEKSKLKLD